MHMKNLRRIVLILTTVFILIVQVFPQNILADVNNVPVSYNNELLSKNYLFNQDMNFKGVISSDRIYFTVDNYWSVKQVSVNFALAQSELLNLQMSNLTFSLNNKPVHSIRISDIKTDGSLNTLNIPSEYIKSGVNELKIEAYKRISDKPCNDDNNTANWLTIKASSYIQVQFNEQKPSDLISEYPYPFYRASNNESSQDTLIMIPDNADEEEMSAAFQIASNIGSFSKDEDINVRVKTYSQADSSMKKDNNIIFLGKYNDSPNEIKAMLTQDYISKLKDDAVVFRNSSPYNDSKKIMCVITDREGMLDKASRFISNEDLISQSKSNICFISKDQNIDKTHEEIYNTFYLKDLGYSDGIYMNGNFRQQTTIDVNLPKNRKILTGSKVKLNVRYSKNLDFNKSLVTVYVNGTPIGSKKLDKGLADADAVELNIPGNVIKSNYVELKIAFDLEMENVNCSFRDAETPWAFIQGDSSIYIPSNGQNSFLFENYPSPFVKDGKFNNVVVVVPEDTSKTDLNSIANMFVYMGKYISDNTGSIKVVKDNNLSKKYSNCNIILLGTPNEIKYIKKINSNLLFKYDNNFSYFISNEKRILLKNFSKTLSSIQLIESPLNKNYCMLVVTAPDKNNLLNTIKYITISKCASSIIGNASLVDNEGKIINHYFTLKNSGKSILEKLDVGGTNIRIFIVYFIVVMILLTVSIILYFRKYKVKHAKRSKGKRYRRKHKKIK